MGWGDIPGHEGWGAAVFADGWFSVGAADGQVLVSHPDVPFTTLPEKGAQTRDGRTATGWQARCECGWTGPFWEVLDNAELSVWGSAPEDLEDGQAELSDRGWLWLSEEMKQRPDDELLEDRDEEERLNINPLYAFLNMMAKYLEAKDMPLAEMVLITNREWSPRP